MKKFIVAAMFSLIGLSANATEFRPKWSCALDFKAHAEGFQVIFGRFDIEGEGTLNCIDWLGGEYVQPVRVTMGTTPLALNVAAGRFDMIGGSAHTTFFAPTPDVMMGLYKVVNARAVLGYGAGVITAVRADTPSLTLEIGIELASGLGVQAGINLMRLEPLGPIEPEIPVFEGK